jgi:hypothetical protein
VEVSDSRRGLEENGWELLEDGMVVGGAMVLEEDGGSARGEILAV